MGFTWIYTPVAMPLFAGAVVMLGTAIMAWRRRRVPGAVYLSCIGVTLAISSVAYGIELGSPDVATVRLMYKLYYLGTLSQSVFLPLMLLGFLGRRAWITRRNVILLVAEPLVSLVLAWTNDWHMLIWQDIRIDRSLGYTVSSFDRGALYLLPNGYGLILIVALLVILARAWLQAASGHRYPIALMMLGLLLPEATFALRLFGVLPPGLDPNAYLASLSALIFAFGMFGHKLFEVLPIMHRSIYRILPNPIFIFDAGGRLADINPAAEELFGLAVDTGIGVEASALLAAWPSLVEILNRPADADLMRPVTIGGEERFLQVRTLRLRGDSGLPAGHTMVIRDITREVRAEDALRLSYARLLVLHQVDNDLNLKLDVDYVAAAALDAAMHLTLGDAALIGFARGGEVAALKVSGAYGPDAIGTRLDTTGVTGRALHSRAPKWVMDVTQDPDYVARIPGMKSLIAVPLIAGARLIGVISVETASPERFSVDVFESVQLLAARVATALDNARAYQERDELVRELDAYAHTVAHDLKSPIGVIAGYADVLAERYQEMPSERVDEMLGLIRDRSLKMADIIDSLLMLARVRGLEGVDIGPLDMAAIVRDVLQRLDPVIAEKDAVITAASSWPQAMGYSPWVEEMLANYMSNALKYGGSPPRVRLHAQRLDNNMVRFNVTDNGPGMTEEDRARLFTPFIRLEGARIADGHGLGLSIVERIATRLGGEVGVESRVGRGSTFFFTLPADPPSSPA